MKDFILLKIKSKEQSKEISQKIHLKLKKEYDIITTDGALF